MACCRGAIEPCCSVLRCMENIPIIGHMVSAVYACLGNKDKAERAGIKATVGIIFMICNLPAEVVDEISRSRSEKLRSLTLSNRRDWMKRHHYKLIRNICFPASHQSGTYHMDRKLRQIPMIEGWSRCQKLDIAAQLDGGIRFFDLRLMTHEGEIWLHHNLVVCLKLQDVLAAVRDFTTANSSEIVCLHLTNDGKDLDWDLVQSQLHEYLPDRLIPQQMGDMLIGDIVDQGKNVVIFGVPNVGYSWQGLSYRWPNKEWPEDLKSDMEHTLSELNIHNPYSLFWYKAECTPGGAMITRSIGGLPGVVAAKCSQDKLEFIEDMAAAVNYHILDVLRNASKMPFNVISIDYVDDQIIGQIVEINNLKETMSIVENEASMSLDVSRVSSLEVPMQKAPLLEVRETNM